MPQAPDIVAELEGLGEKEVRLRLARGEYGGTASWRRDSVEKWLEAKGHERADASMREQIELARSAKNAAWAAAIAAIIAAISAVIAIVSK